jgi:hypothetical protein
MFFLWAKNRRHLSQENPTDGIVIKSGRAGMATKFLNGSHRLAKRTTRRSKLALEPLMKLLHNSRPCRRSHTDQLIGLLENLSFILW